MEGDGDVQMINENEFRQSASKKGKRVDFDADISPRQRHIVGMLPP